VPDAGGFFAYSIQDNVFFTGNNQAPDGVQFTDQARSNGDYEGFPEYTDNICVWQVVDVEVDGVVPSGNYNATCFTWTPYSSGWARASPTMSRVSRVTTATPDRSLNQVRTCSRVSGACI
jgi:hypothetical protein